MKNVPRIYINQNLKTGTQISVEKDVAHYLNKVMRTDTCLVFNNGDEFNAKLASDLKSLIIGDKTDRIDPSNNWTFYFAPIKKTDDMLNMITQMGVSKIQPVITDRTVAHHVNWGRIQKILIEASEQSNRNSVPELLKPIKFADLDKKDLIFADERAAYGHDLSSTFSNKINRILIGPEGGFSESEFNALDKSGAVGLGLGQTILRAETAGVAALAKVL